MERNSHGNLRCRNVVHAEVEEKRFAAPALHARHDGHAAELPLSIESTQHVASLQERFAVRLIAGSLRSAPLSPSGAVQSGHQRPIKLRRRLQVNVDVLIPASTLSLISPQGNGSQHNCTDDRTARADFGTLRRSSRVAQHCKHAHRPGRPYRRVRLGVVHREVSARLWLKVLQLAD